MRQDGVAIAIYGRNPPGVIDFILTEPVRRPHLHGQPAAAPLAARLGTHQSDWRLRLAPEQAVRAWQIQAATTVRQSLAYDFVRFVR